MRFKRSDSCNVPNKDDLVKKFKARRVRANLGAAAFLLIMIVVIVIGIQLADSTIITFVCSCAAGLCCSYITGWYFAYSSEKKDAALIELNYKIDKVDYFLNECKVESSLFGMNTSPKKINLYNYDKGSAQEFFLVLNRMSAIFREIADCRFCGFDQIEVEFYFESNRAKKVRLSEFGYCLEQYCEEAINAGGISFTDEQANAMLMNVMVIETELAKQRKEFLRQRDQIIFGQT